MKSSRASIFLACAAILLAAIIVAFVFAGAGRPKHAYLSEEEALAIAKRELGDYGYDHDAPIKVERGEDFFVFEFPEPSHGEPGEWHGADFAARVRVNAKTGKVDDILVGG